MSQLYDSGEGIPTPEGRVQEPLELEFGREERLCRLYLGAFEVVSGSFEGRFTSDQVVRYEEILARYLGSDVARYIIVHALADARDLQQPTMLG